MRLLLIALVILCSGCKYHETTGTVVKKAETREAHCRTVYWLKLSSNGSCRWIRVYPTVYIDVDSGDVVTLKRRADEYSAYLLVKWKMR